MKNYFFLIPIFLIINLSGQRVSDSLLQELKITTSLEQQTLIHQALMDTYYYTNSDTSLIYAKKAFELSNTLNDPKIHGKSIADLISAYAANWYLDSAKAVIHDAIPYFQETDQIDRLSAAYQNMAVLGEMQNQPDTSLLYLDKALALIQEDTDSLAISNIHATKGVALRVKGYYNLSLDEFLKSLRILEKRNDLGPLGITVGNIAINLEDMGRTEEAMERNLEAINYFRQAEEHRSLTHALNNRAIFLKMKGLYEESLKNHRESIYHAELTEQPYVVQNNYYNMGRMFYHELDMLDSCLIYMEMANKIAIEIEDIYVQGVVARYKTFVAIDRNQIQLAKKLVNESKEFIESYPDPSELSEAYDDMATIYQKLGNSTEALIYWQKSRVIEDSIFTLKKDQQVEELNLIYKTEKKDAEIALLNKQTELDATKKKSLWGGLILLSLLAVGVIYGQAQRRKRIQENAHKEKQIEIEKRKSAEQELEFKKKELTTKALQLASKNEFLNSLEGEINNLKSSIDTSVSKTSQRISRLIHNDQLDDEEWDQFGKEFNSVHQDFLDRLKTQHGEFSKSEMRLIALLKMNLSSKDIANTLRISNDGVKKARYRLRKKMNLESEVDIQSYLLSF